MKEQAQASDWVDQPGDYCVIHNNPDPLALAKRHIWYRSNSEKEGGVTCFVSGLQTSKQICLFFFTTKGTICLFTFRRTPLHRPRMNRSFVSGGNIQCDLINSTFSGYHVGFPRKFILTEICARRSKYSRRHHARPTL